MRNKLVRDCLVFISSLLILTIFLRWCITEINEHDKKQRQELYHITCPSLHVEYIGMVRWPSNHSVLVFNKGKSVTLPTSQCIIEGPL
jgi:hypothetical protein